MDDGDRRNVGDKTDEDNTITLKSLYSPDDALIKRNILVVFK